MIARINMTPPNPQKSKSSLPDWPCTHLHGIPNGRIRRSPTKKLRFLGCICAAFRMWGKWPPKLPGIIRSLITVDQLYYTGLEETFRGPQYSMFYWSSEEEVHAPSIQVSRGRPRPTIVV